MEHPFITFVCECGHPQEDHFNSGCIILGCRCTEFEPDESEEE